MWLTIRFLPWTLFICSICVTTHASEDNFLTRLDQDVFDALYDRPPQHKPLGTIMEGVTEVGDPKTIMGISILLMAYGNRDHHKTGRLMSSAFIGAGVTVFGIKQISRRKRPLDDQLGNSSFPSGHTAYAFVLATIFGDRYPRLRIPLYIGAGVVGISRIYLGRHYASDVVAGATVGTIAGTLVLHHRASLLRWEF